MNGPPSVGRMRRTDEMTIDDVVTATVALLDKYGVDAFSMRALAEQLGRSTMAAYRHVESKESLIRLAAEAVQEDLPELGPLPWYERLEAFATNGWTTSWHAHPWVVDYLQSGGSSPKATRKLAVMREVFRDAGFTESEVDQALIAHWSFLAGTLQLIISLREKNGRRNRRKEDVIFRFNLETWILGLTARANGLEPHMLEQSHIR